MFMAALQILKNLFRESITEKGSSIISLVVAEFAKFSFCLFLYS